MWLNNIFTGCFTLCSTLQFGGESVCSEIVALGNSILHTAKSVNVEVVGRLQGFGAALAIRWRGVDSDNGFYRADGDLKFIIIMYI